MTTNLKLELFDHKNIKEVLNSKVTKLHKATIRLQNIIDSFDAANFDWENVTEAQIEIFQELFDNILSDI